MLNLNSVRIEVLTNMLNRRSKEKSIPGDWEVEVIVPLYKCGDKTVIIIQVSLKMKMFERLQNDKLKTG